MLKIMLFSGRGAFSRIIQLGSGSKFSHVGFALNHPDHGDCIFESTSLGKLKDVNTHKKVKGVQLVPYQARVDTYDGQVFVRDIIGDISDDQMDIVYSYINTLSGIPYEKDNLQLARAALDIFPWQNNEKDESTLFCSELAAKVLRGISVLTHDDTPTNEFTPADFGEDLPLYDGYKWGNIKRIK